MNRQVPRNLYSLTQRRRCRRTPRFLPEPPWSWGTLPLAIWSSTGIPQLLTVFRVSIPGRRARGANYSGKQRATRRQQHSASDAKLVSSAAITEVRIPDGRPPRRDERVTFASSRPELLSGDLAMTPRPHVSLTRLNEAAASRRNLCIFAVIAVAGLLSSILYKHATTPYGADGGEQRLAPACMQWHLAASTAVSRLVHSTRDADLRQVNDSIFRMRRARRNCEAGWF